jgi:AcrR family transcriptional regulator
MGRPLSQEARAKMLAAAQELMVAEGLGACTVEEVARRSGVAKTTIYRHFQDADDLTMTAISGMIEEVAAPDQGSLRADLRAVVLGFRTIVSHEVFRQMFAEMLARAVRDPEFARLYQEAQEMRHAPLRRALQRGIARGEVDPAIDLETAMYFVQGPFVAKRLIEIDDFCDDEIEVFLDLVVKALAPVGCGSASHAPARR